MPLRPTVAGRRWSIRASWVLALIATAAACGTDDQAHDATAGSGPASGTSGGPGLGGNVPVGGAGGDGGTRIAGSGGMPPGGGAGASSAGGGGDVAAGAGGEPETTGGEGGGASGAGGANEAGAAGAGEGDAGGGGSGPAPAWARVLEVTVNAMQANADDELVLAGSITPSLDLGCGTLDNPHPNFVQADVLVASLRSSDGSCRWSYRFAGSDAQADTAASLDLDGDTVHIGGSFRSATIDFGGGPIALFSGSAGSPSPFVARFHDSGTALVHDRSRMFEGRGSVSALESASSLFLTGTFYSYISIDGQAPTTCCQMFDAMYVASLDSMQARNWVTGARVVPSNVIDSVTGMDVAVAGGRVFVSGYFDDSPTSFSGTTVSPTGYTDAYVAAYTPEGALDWVNHYGATATRSLGWSLLPEPSGTVLYIGVASGGTDLGQGALTGFGDHLFVMRLNAAGALQALKTAHLEYGRVFDVARRSDGSVVVLGSYRGTRQFGGFSLSSEAAGDAFLAVLSPDLTTFEHAESFSAPGEDFSFGNVTVLSDDTIALALDFRQWVDIRGQRYLGGNNFSTLVTVLE
jgi:hypothetical protein